jgi:hypothetical protein
MEVKMSDGTTFDLSIETGSDDDGNPVTLAGACLIDGHRGQYGTADVINLARNCGFELTEADQQDIADATTDYGTTATDYVIEIADRAEAYLNSRIESARTSDKLPRDPSSFEFGWHEGEFFLANEAWWEVD